MTMTNKLPKVSLGLLCLLLPAASFAALEVEKQKVYFPTQQVGAETQEVQTVTIKNTSGSSVDFTVSNLRKGNYSADVDTLGDASANFTYSDNCNGILNDGNSTSCQLSETLLVRTGTGTAEDPMVTSNTLCTATLAPANECTLTIAYNQTQADFQSVFWEIKERDGNGDRTANANYPLFVSNYLSESTGTEVARRVSPVIEDVKISAELDTDFTTPLTGTLAAGTYNVRWTVLSYAPMASKVAIYNCGTTAAADDNCAINEAGGDPAETGTISAASSLVSSTVSAEDFADYSYQGEQAQHLQFDAQVVIADDFSAGQHKLALRFFHIATQDQADGISNNISSLLGGSLNFMGLNDGGYYSTDGRRLTVNTPAL